VPRKSLLSLTACCVLISLAPLAQAQTPVHSDNTRDNSPFAIRNQAPWARLFGLPAVQSAAIAAPGQQRFSTVLNISNNFTSSSSGSERVNIDGETYETALFYQRGLSESLALEIYVPYVVHGGGFADNLIEDWHDWLGLDDDGRPDVPRNQLNYSATLGGETVAIDGNEQGLGDIQLGLAWRLLDQPQQQLTLRSQLKLPTGSSSKLIGSGGTDLSLSLNYLHSHLFSTNNLFFAGSAGMLFMEDGDVLPDNQENLVGFGSITLGWNATKTITFKAQLDGHSAFYDSALKELGDTSVQATLGGSLALSPTTRLDLAVVEDIAVNTAPDVTFFIGLSLELQ